MSILNLFSSFMENLRNSASNGSTQAATLKRQIDSPGDQEVAESSSAKRAKRGSQSAKDQSLQQFSSLQSSRNTVASLNTQDQIQIDTVNSTSSNKDQANKDQANKDQANKDQANKLIMTFVLNQSRIDAIDGSPRATLKMNLYSSPLVDHIMDSTAFDHDEQQFWDLAHTIFGEQVGTMNESSTTPSTPPLSPSSLLLSVTPTTGSTEPTTAIKKQRQRLTQWIRDTVSEETHKLGLLDSDFKDDWHRAFFYMSTGQISKAIDLVQQLGDDALGTMMMLHHQRSDIDVWEGAERQIAYWRKRGRFDSMPLYRRKMWYTLHGQLGYVDHIKEVVTQGLSWPQVVLLYTLYGGRLAGDFVSGLTNYHKVVTTGDRGSSGGAVGIHQLLAKKHTAQVPSTCQWYLLLHWWATFSPSTAAKRPAYLDQELQMKLPLRCRWLLLLHVPGFFEADDDTIESWKLKWCDELFDGNLGHLAIQAALFLKSPEAKIKNMLSVRMWWKEHYLSRQLQIPSVWLSDAKALYAYNHKNYDKEVDYHLEANEDDKAKDAILNHMLPALFLDSSRIDTITTYLGRLTTLFPDNMDLQQVISILHNIHIILNDYPRIISLSTVEQMATMVNEVTLAVQNLTTLTECEDLHDPTFCSKIARQLLITASTVMNDEQLCHLLQMCPVDIDVNEALLEHISRANSVSIGKNIVS